MLDSSPGSREPYENEPDENSSEEVDENIDNGDEEILLDLTEKGKPKGKLGIITLLMQ